MQKEDVQLEISDTTIDFHRGAIDYAPQVGNALQTAAGGAWAASEEGQNIEASLQELQVPAIWIGAQTTPIRGRQ